MPTFRSPDPRHVLGAAIALGIAGDYLSRAPVWGLNLALGATAVAGGGLVLAWPGTGKHRAVGHTVWPWLGAMFFAAMWGVRDAPLLLAVDLLAVLGLLSVGLIRVQGVALRIAGAIAVLSGPVRAAWEAGTGGFRLAAALPRLNVAGPTGHRVRAVGLGLLLAVPAVLVFGSLFASADPIFRSTVFTIFGIDLGPLVSHASVAGGLAWVAAGFWWALARPTAPSELPLPRLGLGAIPLITVLGATALVFTIFVATQAGSLFGGEAYVREATGLTYAEYARRGFVQMVFGSALTLPLVYAASFAAGETTEGESRSLRALLALQLALTALVLSSALWRVGLYVRAYGLTEDRLYGLAVTLWLAATMAVFARTVLRGRAQGAPFGALVAAAVTLAALNLANPTALIARYNLAHQDRREADVSHLARLGGDAVPVMVSRLDLVSSERRCPMARELTARHSTSKGDWRGWSLARSRARAAVATLGDLAASCDGPQAAQR